MPSEFDQIRIAISRGLAVKSLRSITKLSLAILQDHSPKHPSVFLSLASLSRWVADAWDDHLISSQVADRVEAQLKPHLEALLDVADGDPAEVCAVLDAAALAFRIALSQTLDS
jgi:hypothetical protein